MQLITPGEFPWTLYLSVSANKRSYCINIQLNVLGHTWLCRSACELLLDTNPDNERGWAADRRRPHIRFFCAPRQWKIMTTLLDLKSSVLRQVQRSQSLRSRREPPPTASSPLTHCPDPLPRRWVTGVRPDWCDALYVTAALLPPLNFRNKRAVVTILLFLEMCFLAACTDMIASVSEIGSDSPFKTHSAIWNRLISSNNVWCCLLSTQCFHLSHSSPCTSCVFPRHNTPHYYVHSQALKGSHVQLSDRFASCTATQRGSYRLQTKTKDHWLRASWRQQC